MGEGDHLDHLDHLEHAFEHTRAGLAIIDSGGRIVRVNRAAAAVVGVAPQEMRGEAVADMVHPDDRATVFAELARTLEGGIGGPADLRLRRPDGSWVWIRAEATGLPTAAPSIFASFVEITAEREAVDRLSQASAESARRAAQQAAVAHLGHEALSGQSLEELTRQATAVLVATLDVPYGGVLLDDGHPAGPLLVAAAGLLTDEVGRYRFPRVDGGLAAVLAQPAPVVHTDLRDDLQELVPALADAGISVMAAAPILPSTGRPGVISVGAPDSTDFTAEDLTFLDAIANVLASALDAADALDNLRHNALHDALTGLPNRALVLDRLEVALEAAASSGSPVAVLVCDVDRFKVVNDGLGHAAGDAVLRAVASHLRAQVRPGDTVGRFGGDEFVVVCPDIGDVDTVITIAERLASAVSQPVSVRGNELVATVSIGIAVGSAPGAEAAAGLLSDADAAMYRAKARGRNRFELFDDAMRARADHRLRTETELRRAIERDELVLHYQPILELDSGRLVGVEALLRWAHPERGLLEPEAFVAVAGDSGLVPEVGAWALGEAARQTVRWVADGWWGDRFTAVNLAPRQLTDPLVVDRLEEVLTSTGVDPELLRIEITEDSLVDDSEQVAELLEAIRKHGIGISVDDFGTGYSSLAYLKRLPVDALKLDQGFVSGLGEDGDDMVIAAAVIVMAQALGLKVVAEGVETRPQLEVLRAMGCDLVQGYLFARPLPAEELERWAKAAAGR